MKKTVLALVTTSLLVLSGCGGGGSAGGDGGGLSSEDQKVADNLSKYMTEQQEGQDMFAFKEDDADCVGEGMVNDIGVDELKEYGFLKEDGTVNEDVSTLKMSTADAESMTDTMFECTDMMANIEKSMSGQLEGQNPAVKECVNDAVTEDGVRSAFVALFSGNEEEAQKGLMGPIMECAAKGAQP